MGIEVDMNLRHLGRFVPAPGRKGRLVLWFGYGLSLRGSCVGNLIPNDTVLGGSGTFKRWGLVGGVQVIWEHDLRRD
jgi:hypothetical protein